MSQNTNNSNNNKKKKIAPRQANTWTFVNPYASLADIVGPDKHPSHYALPKTNAQLKQGHAVPYPEGIRYLMVNSAIDDVTQLPKTLILNKKWKEKKEVPMIKELPDCEWLHLLLCHPKEDQYNRWRREWIPAPAIWSSHISHALNEWQLAYTIYAQSNKASKPAQDAKIKLRQNWRLLPDPVQQQILQMLAPRPNYQHPLLSPNFYAPQDPLCDHHFYRHDDNKQHLLEVAKFWKKQKETKYNNLALYDHEGEVHDKFLTAEEFEAISRKRDKLVKQNQNLVQRSQQQAQQSQAAATTNITNVENLLNANPSDLVNNNNLSHVMNPNSNNNNQNNENDDAASQNATGDTNFDEDSATIVNNQQQQSTEQKTQDTEMEKSAPLQSPEAIANAQTQQQQQQLYYPPTPWKHYKPEIDVHYWDGTWEFHRTWQWRFERACGELENENKLDRTKVRAIYRRVHAQKYDNYNKMKNDLTLDLEHYNRRPSYQVRRGTGVQWKPSQHQPYATATSSDPNPPPNPNPNQQQPQQQQQTYYERLARQHNPQWNTNQHTTYYNNPTNPQQLASNIQTAFATNTMPQPIHTNMPAAPTGTVITPAPATTQVTTRFPTLPNQFLNLTNVNVTAAETILGSHGAALPPNARQNVAQPSSAANTSKYKYIHIYCL